MCRSAIRAPGRSACPDAARSFDLEEDDAALIELAAEAEDPLDSAGVAPEQARRAVDEGCCEKLSVFISQFLGKKKEKHYPADMKKVKGFILESEK